MLVVHCCEDGELHAQDEDAATHRDEDFAHNEIPDLPIRRAEVDHQTQREDVERDANVEEPLEATRSANRIADDEEEDARDDLEGAVDVARFGDGEVVDDLEEGREVAGPAVVGHLVCHV